MAVFNKRQGESLSVKYGLKLDGVEQNFATGWLCKLVVKLKSGGIDGAIKAIDKTITDQTLDNTRYIVSITPAEMAALSDDDYYLLVELSNASSNINKEFHDTLKVAKQGI
ncbi:MAG: hypothetical protein COB22_07835 [Cycloclasticus sp.]|nr:MAG: hypothetical protein COB22_07835 [Cycloclasticus sp.]